MVLCSAILRLFKFSREHRPASDLHDYVATCAKLVQLHGNPLVAFDVSFRDGLRLALVCTWQKSGTLSLDQVQDLCGRAL